MKKMLVCAVLLLFLLTSAVMADVDSISLGYGQEENPRGCHTLNKSLALTGGMGSIQKITVDDGYDMVTAYVGEKPGFTLLLRSCFEGDTYAGLNVVTKPIDGLTVVLRPIVHIGGTGTSRLQIFASYDQESWGNWSISASSFAKKAYEPDFNIGPRYTTRWEENTISACYAPNMNKSACELWSMGITIPTLTSYLGSRELAAAWIRLRGGIFITKKRERDF